MAARLPGYQTTRVNLRAHALAAGYQWRQDCPAQPTKPTTGQAGHTVSVPWRPVNVPLPPAPVHRSPQPRTGSSRHNYLPPTAALRRLPKRASRHPRSSRKGGQSLLVWLGLGLAAVVVIALVWWLVTHIFGGSNAAFGTVSGFLPAVAVLPSYRLGSLCDPDGAARAVSLNPLVTGGK